MIIKKIKNLILICLLCNNKNYNTIFGWNSDNKKKLSLLKT